MKLPIGLFHTQPKDLQVPPTTNGQKSTTYHAYVEAFETLHPNRNDEEEWQYMLMGSDFIFDLLVLLDIMKPRVDVMLQMQSLDCPVWKLKKIWPNLLRRLERAGIYWGRHYC